MSIWGTCAALLVFFGGVAGPSDDTAQSVAPVAEHVDREAELERLLDNVRAGHEAGTLILTREKWPRNGRIAVEIGQWFRHDSGGYHFFGEFADCNHRVFASGSIPGPLRPTQRRFVSWGDDGTFEVPTACIGPNGEIEVNVRFSRTTREGRFATDFERLLFMVDLVDSVEEVIAPVSDEQATRKLADVMALFLVGPRRDGRPGGNAMVGVIVPAELPGSVAVGMRIELLDGESVIAGARVCVSTRKYRRTAGLMTRDGAETFIVPVELDQSQDDFHVRAKGVQLRARISPDPEYALRDFDNDRYLHWDEPFIVEVDTSALEE